MSSKNAELHFIYAMVISAVLLASVAPVEAQQDVVPPGIQRTTLPESILLPIRVDGSASPVGWVLSHRNGYSGADTPDLEIQSRIVEWVSETANSGVVAWEVTRTRNDRCLDQHGTPCPDFVRVIVVPEGFTAVPQDTGIGEGEVFRIYIVPAGMM